MLSLTPLALVLMAGVVIVTSPSPAPTLAGADGRTADRIVTVGDAPADAPGTRDVPRLPETRGPVDPQDRSPLELTGLRIVLPRLGIDLPLAPGDPDRDVPRPGFAGATPEHSAFVYPGSRNPGDNGNTYIYAHARAGMFLSLWNATLGDSVAIARSDGSIALSYQVTLIVPRVAPTETRWLDPDGDERLTLQTSTGPRPEDPRFIVVAHPLVRPAEAPRLP